MTKTRERVLVLAFYKGQGNKAHWLASLWGETFTLLNTDLNLGETPEQGACRCLNELLWNIRIPLGEQFFMNLGESHVDGVKQHLFYLNLMLDDAYLLGGMLQQRLHKVAIDSDQPALYSMDEASRIALEAAPIRAQMKMAPLLATAD